VNIVPGEYITDSSGWYS